MLAIAVSAAVAAAEAMQGMAPLSAASEGARDVLERVRPSVIQIKGFFGSNTAQAFHGTGFAVAEGGVFMTNYHVVAEQVQNPTKYRLEYRTPDGATGKVTVLAVDVRHDLAVVRASGHAPPPLKVQPVAPAKGERAYSVGFPLDVGLTITEGVANGKVEDSFEARIHYSGAVNGGMSGGPAMNGAGDVIGVNVSGYTFQQLVAFLVPVEHALVLRDRAPAEPPEAEQLKKDVVVQMTGHSSDLLKELSGPLATHEVAGYLLPAKLAQFVDCSASGDPTPDQPVQSVRVNCSAKASVHVQQGLHSGDLKYQHIVLSTEKLGSWRFAAKLSALTTAAGERGSRRHVGPLSCRSSVVALKGFDASLLVCVRAYRKLKGLYDFTVRVTSLNGTRQGFTSHLDMFGLEYEPGMAFIRRYVDAMEWKS